MTEEKPKVAGWLYWKSGLKGPTAQVIPIDSDSPAGSYLAKYPLTKDEIKLSILLLEKRYPAPAMVEDEEKK